MGRRAGNVPVAEAKVGCVEVPDGPVVDLPEDVPVLDPRVSCPGLHSVPIATRSSSRPATVPDT